MVSFVCITCQLKKQTRWHMRQAFEGPRTGQCHLWHMQDTHMHLATGVQGGEVPRAGQPLCGFLRFLKIAKRPPALGLGSFLFLMGW